MQHISAYKLATTHKMTFMYFVVNIYINNQSTLYKVNGVVNKMQQVNLNIHHYTCAQAKPTAHRFQLKVPNVVGSCAKSKTVFTSQIQSSY